MLVLINVDEEKIKLRPAENNDKALNDVNDSQYKTDVDMNKLNASADTTPKEEDEEQPK